MDIIEHREVQDAMTVANATNRNKDSDILAGAILIASAINHHANVMDRMSENLRKVADKLHTMSYHFEQMERDMRARNEIEKTKIE